MNQSGVAGNRAPQANLAVLRSLSRQFPSVDAALAEAARLAGELTLPRGTIHIVSDVHGEHKKLRHIINNASGTLRPLVERLFGERLSAAELQDFLSLIFYPKEMLERLAPQLEDADKARVFALRVLRDLFELIRVLARRTSASRASKVFQPEYRELFRELLFEPSIERGPEYVNAIIESLVRDGRSFEVIRRAVHAVRNLAIDEIIVAGDTSDRGPRTDEVIEYLRRQPRVSITWGNHDAVWIGACLGQEACIGHVLRISLRYRRLSQLEEGYGITLQPLEHLVRTVYADDLAESFMPKGMGLREKVMIARMQKAAAIMQFKLEGQTIERNPQMDLAHRRLLHRIDHAAGTVEIDGETYPLRDTFFPTIDPAHPYELSPEEQACMRRIRQSFLHSQLLWEHMRYLVQHGAMYLRRDDHLIFHGCMPVDEDGEFLSYEIDGEPRRGRALFEAIEKVVVRSLDSRQQKDIDLLWYLWCGPTSPLFGKDRITTFERDLVEDERTHKETKNPYFRLIHDRAFCERVLSEMGVDWKEGIIVNGHVPVKLEKGESPMKESGKAITIDGAFSEAYGDHGFTLVLNADRTHLALHHHFDSVEAAVEDGVDIIPTTTVVKEYAKPRRVGDTERGAEIRAEIDLLEQLVDAYRRNEIRPA
jgi:fructose-1,6-bisphosphatase-3